jgi:phosphoribosyl-ATP pyrophosphohydrolase/phosphoribosyl-AMP cyclohydrolase
MTCFNDAPLTGAGRLGFLAELEQIVAGRIAAEQHRALQADAAPPSSYTAKLYAAGPKRLAQKVGEEGLETALAAAAGSDTELVSEAADLIYHLTVCLQARGLSLEKIADELRERHARDRQSRTISTAGERKL